MFKNFKYVAILKSLALKTTMWGNDKTKWYPLKGTMVILGLNVDYNIICKKKIF